MRRAKKTGRTLTIVLPAALLLLRCGLPESPSITTDPGLAWVIAGSGVPGVSVAVIEDFAIDYLEVHGVRDETTGEPVTERTLFQAASNSKAVTTMAALRLVLEGRIGLDEDINRALSSWQVPENELTRRSKGTGGLTR